MGVTASAVCDIVAYGLWHHIGELVDMYHPAILIGKDALNAIARVSYNGNIIVVADKTCAECKRAGRLTDRRGIEFPIDCHTGCSEILNSVPVYMADRLGEIRNTDFLLLYFTDESKEKTALVIQDYIRGGKPKGEFTRGLLYRGVE